MVFEVSFINELVSGRRNIEAKGKEAQTGR